jgi:hypothetical protein
MKKPSNLNLKEKVTIKRTKATGDTFNKRKENYDKIKQLRQIVKRKKEDNVQAVRDERKRVEEMRKRREINEFKSGSYQLVTLI